MNSRLGACRHKTRLRGLQNLTPQPPLPRGEGEPEARQPMLSLVRMGRFMYQPLCAQSRRRSNHVQCLVPPLPLGGQGVRSISPASQRGIALDWLRLRVSRYARLAPEQQRRNHADQRDACRDDE